MAKRTRPKSNVKPESDTRQRSQPVTPAEQKAAAKSELYTELQAELVRLDMQGFLFRRWMRQALGIGSSRVGFKFFLDDFEEGFKAAQSQNKEYNPRELVVGWDRDAVPNIVKLSQDAAVFRNPPKKPGDKGSSGFGSQPQPTAATTNKKSPLKK